MTMDKRLLVQQLGDQLRATAANAGRESDGAAHEARFGATAAEKREDARVALEYANLSRAQLLRARKAQGELDQLLRFAPDALGRGARIELGAIVEVENELGEGRTFFLAPTGAGITLTGPGGDGLLSVVTQASPIGKAVLGRREGDEVDVVVGGDTVEWTITYVG